MTKLSKSAVLNFERHILTVCLLKQFLISDLVKPVDIDVKNRRAFCMRMRQFGLLRCHRGILCELFTYSTSICRLFSGAE